MALKFQTITLAAASIVLAAALTACGGTTPEGGSATGTDTGAAATGTDTGAAGTETGSETGAATEGGESK